MNYRVLRIGWREMKISDPGNQQQSFRQMWKKTYWQLKRNEIGIDKWRHIKLIAQKAAEQRNNRKLYLITKYLLGKHKNNTSITSTEGNLLLLLVEQLDRGKQQS